MTRRDYINDPLAPSANSIAVACSAFVQRDDGQILLIRRTDNGLFSIPGGQLEPGETLTRTAIRETHEETGVEIEVVGLVGIFSNPEHVIAYDNGEVRQEFSVCFRARPIGGQLTPSIESAQVIWVPLDTLDDYEIHQSTRLRISCALSGVIYYS